MPHIRFLGPFDVNLANTLLRRAPSVLCMHAINTHNGSRDTNKPAAAAA